MTVANLLEIRWHGRGGQGAKTGALLLGEALVNTGKYMQAFPDYGPERMGAPMRAFNRISDEPIMIHSGVTQPEVVIVLDSTLLGKVDVISGLPDEGTLLVNTSKSPKEIRTELNLCGRRVFTVDASQIASETIGRPIPNTPMLGALVKVAKIIDFDLLLADTKVRLEKKFKNKPKVIAGNTEAIQRAYREVLGE